MATHTPAFRNAFGKADVNLEPAASKSEQSNSCIIYGDRLMLKFFRRLEAGINPELEIGRFLATHRFAHTPPLAGALEYFDRGGDPYTLAVLSTFVPECQDAWEFTQDALSRFYERVQALPTTGPQPALPSVASITRPASREVPPQVTDLLGTYLESARLLGTRTAEMHLALASDTEDPEFKSETFTANAQRGLYQSMRTLTRQNFQLLAKQLKTLPADAQAQAQRVLGLETEILNRFRSIYARRLNTERIRHHGDYHLGQVLHTGKDFLIIDFEGEPAVAMGERRLKRSPLRDVAGMIRSFIYAAYAALDKHAQHGPLQDPQVKTMEFWARFWARWVSTIFFESYRRAAGQASFLPQVEADLQTMMDVFLLRKAVYELGYELNNRPGWVKIPLQGILELMDQNGTP